MAGKEAGLGDGLWISGVDVSGSIASVSDLGGGPALLTVPDITQRGQARIGLVRDGRATLGTYFTPADHHPNFAALPRTDVVATYRHGSAIGNPAATLVCKQTNYDPTRGADGSLSFSVSAVGNAYGLEWGVQGTAGIRTDTTATNGASHDNGAATNYGLVAYLHLFAFTGTSVTVKLQSSSDNGVGDAWADVTGGSFTATSTPVTAQRIATATNQTIERYLRVVTTGTFTNARFGVMIMRNEVAP